MAYFLLLNAYVQMEPDPVGGRSKYTVRLTPRSARRDRGFTCGFCTAVHRKSEAFISELQIGLWLPLPASVRLRRMPPLGPRGPTVVSISVRCAAHANLTPCVVRRSTPFFDRDRYRDGARLSSWTRCVSLR